jgi:2,3-dihydroxy-p-cumate/2,3-dihydroxybenzoate 3,4-dioxygenase
MTQPYRYKKLGYVALNVSDLGRSTGFYRDVVGLELIYDEPGRVAFFRCEDYHCLVLYQGKIAGLKRIAFEMESEADLRAADDALTAIGVAVDHASRTECTEARVERALRYRVPGADLPFELYVGPKKWIDEPFAPSVADIERLGHIVLVSPEWKSSAAWLTGNAQFRMSDMVDGAFAFMRCYPNPLHHSIGLGKASSTHLHHVNFMVRSIDDIGKALNRFKRAGVPIVFGPGRHKASGSIFLYYLDPDGMTMEYSFGMELFHGADARGARRLEPSLETVDEWGGAPAAAYGSIGQIEELTTA